MRTFALFVALSLAGCWTANAWRYEKFTATAERLLSAKVAGDSVELEQLIADSTVRQWLAIVSETEPELLRHAQGHLRPENGTIEGDSAYVTFVFRYKGRREKLGFDFIRENGDFKVRTIGLPERI